MSQQSSGGLLFGLLTSVVINIGLLGAGVFLFQKEQKASSAFAQLQAETSAMAEQHRNDIATLEGNFQTEVQQINADWVSKLEEVKKEQQNRITRIYDQINQIVYDSDDTLEYIGVLEDKLKQGKDLSVREIESLEMVSAGLTYLHQQYAKPIHEFRELESFLAEQLQVGAIDPKERFGVFQRLFGKDYKEAEKEYYRDVGKQEAFEVARNRVAIAYAGAQRQMNDLALSRDKYLQTLQEIIASNTQDVKKIDEFFSISRNIIDIHQGIMKLQDQEQATLPSVTP